MGNPGMEYENTRHNVGFWFLDYAAHISGFEDFYRSGPCLITGGRVKSLRLLFVKPMLYMNRSGQALTRLWRAVGFSLDNLLVCYDDAALPAGKIRIRTKGSAGGHKGMASILEAIGSDACPRLRLGVGRGADDNMPEDLSEFVLDEFEQDEEDAVIDRFPDALLAVKVFFTDGIDEAMSRFNR